MKLSVLSSLDQASGHAGGFQEHLDFFYKIGRTADRLGYSTLFLFRNRLNDSNLVTDPLLLQAAIASEVTGLRLGVGYAPLSYLDPVALAENCATLDVLSGGRLSIAVDEGMPIRGTQPISPRMAEHRKSVGDNGELLRTALRGERFCAEGASRRATNLQIPVRPLQAPHPPIYTAVYDRRTAADAGRRGFRMFIAPHAALSSSDELAVVVRAYRTARRSAGLPPEEDDVVVFCLAHAQDDHGQAVAAARGAFHRHAILRPTWVCRNFDRALRESHVLVGGPAALADKLARLAHIGISHVALMPTFGGVAAAAALETLRVARQVVPVSSAAARAC